jgi:hypothetical protein
VTTPSREVLEALEKYSRSREGSAVREWIEESLADYRDTVETPGAPARDFHAGSAAALAAILRHFPKRP